MKRKNIILLNTIAVLFLIGCCPFGILQEKEEWKPLFNGRNLDGWIVKIHHHETGINYGNTFRVEDGIIKVRYDQYQDFDDQFGHLYYQTPFSYYHLKLEYRFSGQLHKGA